MIDKLKNKLLELRWLCTPCKSSILAKQYMDEFMSIDLSKDLTNPSVDRFYIKYYDGVGVEIRDRLKHDKVIVDVTTGNYSRDKCIANMVLDMILVNYHDEWDKKF